jgi:uncharacterized protein YcbK (DUF882 family)
LLKFTGGNMPDEKTTPPDRRLTQHFMLSEFWCPCCHQVDEKNAAALAHALENVHALFSQPMLINSSFRCPSYNVKAGGKADSQHLTGRAADICCIADSDRFALAAALIDSGFRCIGIGKTFIHADLRTPTLPLLWIY